MQDFQYIRPETLQQVLKLMNMYGSEAKILAGGTDVIIVLRNNSIHCKYLVDIKGIEELHSISYNGGIGLTIGSAVTLNEIIDCHDMSSDYQILIDAAKVLANTLIRNRATLVGNICNSSPGGDMLPASLVLEGRACISSVNGHREVLLKDFFTGVKKNVLKENEMVVKVIYPPIQGKGRFIKRSRIKGHDLSQISAAGYLRKDGNLKLSLGAVAITPVLIEYTENFKVSNFTEYRNKIAEAVINRIKPIGDVRATKEYRIAMARYLTCKIVDELKGGR
ncbi:FAD binding domain-containing protein [Clostridium sp. MT-14]|uniref:FAD binding domain-containing protein n=1 Tax=Clostridium sp. MT-14 TaxID=3348360 RepID=UPI00156C80EE|nr:Carbon monoxide dehydrogenase medium chain [Clostridiaceae bacterium BL-3]